MRGDGAARAGKIAGRLLAAALMLAAGVVQARSPLTLPGVSRGMPYAQARTKVLALGYSPYQPRGPRMMQGSPCGGRDEICRAYPETAACAGTAAAQCDFVFTKGSTFIEIETVNESLSALTVDKVFGLTRPEADTRS